MSEPLGFMIFCAAYGLCCYCAWRYMGLPYKDEP